MAVGHSDMTRDRQIIIELVVQTEHPELLEGLDTWLRLGLISDGFVRQLAKAEFSCPLPEVAAIAPRPAQPDPVAAPTPPTPPVLPRSRPVPRPTAHPNVLSRTLQAFMAEISVVWLLFLGVFLVVVSSGVLAATQWRNVPPVGQYSILWSYTIAFGMASYWTRQRPTLQLTSRMLAIAALLLLPVNTWMMDGMQIGQTVPGLLVVAIAVVSLAGLAIALLRPLTPIPLIAALLGVSGLQWGWGIPGIPLGAVYGGTAIATTSLLWNDRMPPSPEERSPTGIAPTVMAPIAIAAAVLLLIGRAVFAAGIAPSQIGLALGICGWLISWLARQRQRRAGAISDAPPTPSFSRWGWVGTAILVMAWAVTVGSVPPWQAIAISGLGGWLLLDQLKETEQSGYLTAAFGVGWQLLWLLWLCVPEMGRSQIINSAIAIAGSAGMPIAIAGLGFFPYIMATVAGAIYLQKQQKIPLARHAQQLALGFGVLLIAVSSLNPWLRSLTLSLAIPTLAAGVRLHPPTRWLTYALHGLALATLCSWLDTLLPQLSPTGWAGVTLAIALLEWGYAAVDTRDSQAIWATSAWHLGIGFATVSYLLLWYFPWSAASEWKLLWLLIPVSLTALSYRPQFPDAAIAIPLSAIALLMNQVLLWEFPPTRLAGLAIATGIMGLNTHRAATVDTPGAPPAPLASLTVGFGILLGLTLLWETLPTQRTVVGVVHHLAIATVILTALHDAWRRRRTHLAMIYRDAIAGWAVGLFSLTLLLAVSSQLTLAVGLTQPHPQWLMVAGGLVIASGYGTWQRPTAWGWSAIAVSLELLLVTTLLFTTRSLQGFGWANLGLAGAALLLADGWVRWQTRSPQTTPTAVESAVYPPPSPYPLIWHLIPLVYAGLALGDAHLSWRNTTGLVTIAAAVLAIAVGRRPGTLGMIRVLGLIGLSVGLYEYWIGQVWQITGRIGGDDWVILAAIAIAIAGAYILLQRPLARHLRLSVPTLQSLAHLHWGLGSVLLLVAPWLGLTRTGHGIWIAIALGLSAYALGQGNPRLGFPAAALTPGVWQSLGIWQGFAAIAAWFWLTIPTQPLLDWAGAIAAGVAVSVYCFPWARWGWTPQPAQQSAIALPAIALLLTAPTTNFQTLLLVAAFYAGFASHTRQIRLSYGSVLLANWAIARLLRQIQLTAPLWTALLVGGSLLYLAQVEPYLQAQSQREQRHWLRCLAAALICLTAFAQAEQGISGLSPVVAGLLVIAIGFAFILLGLVQRVRAFLYVGTLTFLLQVLWQIWQFGREYSLLLWVLGIVVGLVLIWIAATFEARKAQADALLQQWVTALEAWE